MIRFLVVTLLAAVLGAAMAFGRTRSGGGEEMRRVAIEEACRTIVEAGLVRSCTIRK